jgi:hypothetical protein
MNGRICSGKYCICTRLCIFCSIIGAILLGTAIAAALLAVWSTTKATTSKSHDILFVIIFYVANVYLKYPYLLSFLSSIIIMTDAKVLAQMWNLILTFLKLLEK